MPLAPGASTPKGTPKTNPKPEILKSGVTTGICWEEFPVGSEPDESGKNKPAKILGCGGCTLFRSKRRAHFPDLKPPCTCATTKSIRGYELHPQDIQGNTKNAKGKSGFELYLKAIKAQLRDEANIGLLRDAFFEGLPYGVHTWDIYLQILIEVVAKGITQKNGASLQEGVWVRSIQVQPLKEEDRDSSKVDLRQMRSLNEWKRRLKKTHTGYRGIGIAIDFRVLHPDHTTYFGVEMGIPLLKKKIPEYKFNGMARGHDSWKLLANSLSDAPLYLEYVPPANVGVETTSDHPMD